MKNRIKIIGMMGTAAFLFSGAYFIQLYNNLTQLIVSLSIGGYLVFISLLYLYNWMTDKDRELKEINKAIDMTRDYMREIDENEKKLEIEIHQNANESLRDHRRKDK